MCCVSSDSLPLVFFLQGARQAGIALVSELFVLRSSATNTLCEVTASTTAGLHGEILSSRFELFFCVGWEGGRYRAGHCRRIGGGRDVA